MATKPKIAPGEWDSIARAIDAGSTMQEQADARGVAVSTISRGLKRRGATVRTVHKKTRRSAAELAAASSSALEGGLPPLPDDAPEALRECHQRVGQIRGLIAEATVEKGLSAAGLIHRKLDLIPGPS